MTAPSRPRAVSAQIIDINHLRRGRTYLATTADGFIAAGEYLGIEVDHDEWRILLRGVSRTDSIPVADLRTVLAA